MSDRPAVNDGSSMRRNHGRLCLVTTPSGREKTSRVGEEGWTRGASPPCTPPPLRRTDFLRLSCWRLKERSIYCVTERRTTAYIKEDERRSADGQRHGQRMRRRPPMSKFDPGDNAYHLASASLLLLSTLHVPTPWRQSVALRSLGGGRRRRWDDPSPKISKRTLITKRSLCAWEIPRLLLSGIRAIF